MISSDCETMAGNITWGSDASFKNMIEKAVDMATIGFKVVAGFMGASLTPNLKKALNAARCMVNSLGNNAWNFLAAAWWAAK